MGTGQERRRSSELPAAGGIDLVCSRAPGRDPAGQADVIDEPADVSREPRREKDGKSPPARDEKMACGRARPGWRKWEDKSGHAGE